MAWYWVMKFVFEAASECWLPEVEKPRENPPEDFAEDAAS
jgi:hypothetical protein